MIGVLWWILRFILIGPKRRSYRGRRNPFRKRKGTPRPRVRRAP